MEPIRRFEAAQIPHSIKEVEAGRSLWRPSSWTKRYWSPQPIDGGTAAKLPR